MKEQRIKPEYELEVGHSRRSMRGARTLRFQTKEKIFYGKNVKASLVDQGFSFAEGGDIQVPVGLHPAMRSLLSECADLPLDKYCAEGTRRRRHSRLIL